MKPTDTQRSLLEAAAQHPQRKLTDFPANLLGGARNKVLTALCNAKWIEPADPAALEHTITQAGFEAIGAHTPTPRNIREGTKQFVLIELLKRPEGATLTQMTDATGWQVNTVRGAMAGALKKKLGLHITSDKQQGSQRVYRITTTTA